MTQMTDSKLDREPMSPQQRDLLARIIANPLNKVTYVQFISGGRVYGPTLEVQAYRTYADGSVYSYFDQYDRDGMTIDTKETEVRSAAGLTAEQRAEIRFNETRTWGGMSAANARIFDDFFGPLEREQDASLV